MTKTRLFLDYNHLCMRVLFSQVENINNPNPDFQMHKHILLTTLMYNIKKFKPNEVVIAIDGRKNWRFAVYPDYKKHRRENRDKDLFPWDRYFEYINEFTADMQKYFPFIFLDVKFAEADDIIAVLSRNLSDDDYKSIIVTSDKDYVQLLMDENISVFDPIKKKFKECDDPKKDLAVHLLTGDKGDSVPAIKPRVGVKTALKILETDGLFDQVMQEEVEIKDKEGNVLRVEKCIDNYNRNKKMIDLHQIPKKIKKLIIDSYHAYDFDSVNCNGLYLMKFFVKNKLRKLSEDGSSTAAIMKRLKNGKESSIKKLEGIF